jgi:transposase
MELTLTAAERARLRAAMKRAASARLYRRLQAMLLAGEGASAARIAAITGASARSVQNWCASWRRSDQHRHPHKALAEKPRLGRRPGLPDLGHARLLAELAKDPLSLGYAATNWTVPLFAAHLQRQGWPISQRTLRRRLHAAGLRWKRPRFVFAEPEPRT